MTDSVEMHPVFEWTCDHCGRDQITRILLAQATAEQAEEIKANIDPEEVWDGYVYSVPDMVYCSHCDSEFTPIYPEEMTKHEEDD